MVVKPHNSVPALIRAKVGSWAGLARYAQKINISRRSVNFHKTNKWFFQTQKNAREKLPPFKSYSYLHFRPALILP